VLASVAAPLINAVLGIVAGAIVLAGVTAVSKLIKTVRR